MIVKKGTPCYISKNNKKGKIHPILDEYGVSFFSHDQEVEIKKTWKCSDKGLIAVLTAANCIEHLVAGENIKTIVWIEKSCL